MVLKSFARLGYRPYGKPSATRTGCVRLSPCLRIVSASIAAGLARRGRLLRLPGDGVWAPSPTHNLKAGAGGAAGKSAKRRQWRKKRADFEEVPRLADTAVAGKRMARRWATAAPYGSSTGKRRVGGTWRAVGRASARVAPTEVERGVYPRFQIVRRADRCVRPYGGTDSHVASLLGMTGEVFVRHSKTAASGGSGGFALLGKGKNVWKRKV